MNSHVPQLTFRISSFMRLVTLHGTLHDSSSSGAQGGAVRSADGVIAFRGLRRLTWESHVEECSGV